MLPVVRIVDPPEKGLSKTTFFKKLVHIIPDRRTRIKNPE